MIIQKPTMHLDCYSFSLLDLALAFFEGLEDLILSSSLEPDLREIIDLCDTRRKKISSLALNSTATYLLRCAMCYAMCYAMYLAKSSRAAHYKYSKYLELIATRIGRGGKPYAPIFLRYNLDFLS